MLEDASFKLSGHANIEGGIPPVGHDVDVIVKGGHRVPPKKKSTKNEAQKQGHP